MNEYQTLVHSPSYQEAHTRVVRQLFEALLFEEAVRDVQWEWDNHAGDDEQTATVIIPGKSPSGKPVAYHCKVLRSLSFERIRLLDNPSRVSGGEQRRLDDIGEFIVEVADFIDTDASRLQQFSHELQQTLIKHAQSLEGRGVQPLRDQPYDQQEARLCDAHPYHPCFKSRLGFTLADNRAYGPESMPSVRPLLLAVHKSCAQFSLSEDYPLDGLAEDRNTDVNAIVAREFGERVQTRYLDALHELHLPTGEYLPLPVHPWQWQEVLAPLCHSATARRELVPVGWLHDNYLPQQSIRTLANQSQPRRASLKLSMNLTNTSTSRVLAPHTIANAALISDWLQQLVERDRWLCAGEKPVILREFMSVSFNPKHPPAGLYGAAACIFRESVHTRKAAGESVTPVTALIHLDRDKRPLIDHWLQQHGLEIWLNRLFSRVYLPVLHMLWAHGIALESHAQNMLLLHRNGLPERVALKDFHDGIRFSRKWLSTPEFAGHLTEAPPVHAAVNPNSFLETHNADELRDFTFDALAFVNLAELAWFLYRHYQFPETRFWQLFTETVLHYQQRFPQLRENFSRFDIFAPGVQVEQLASRRFKPEIRLRVRNVSNPLYHAITEGQRHAVITTA